MSIFLSEPIYWAVRSYSATRCVIDQFVKSNNMSVLKLFPERLWSGNLINVTQTHGDLITFRYIFETLKRLGKPPLETDLTECRIIAAGKGDMGIINLIKELNGDTFIPIGDEEVYWEVRSALLGGHYEIACLFADQYDFVYAITKTILRTYTYGNPPPPLNQICKHMREGIPKQELIDYMIRELPRISLPMIKYWVGDYRLLKRTKRTDLRNAIDAWVAVNGDPDQFLRRPDIIEKMTYFVQIQALLPEWSSAVHDNSGAINSILYCGSSLL